MYTTVYFLHVFLFPVLSLYILFSQINVTINKMPIIKIFCYTTVIPYFLTMSIDILKCWMMDLTSHFGNAFWFKHYKNLKMPKKSTKIINVVFSFMDIYDNMYCSMLKSTDLLS